MTATTATFLAPLSFIVMRLGFAHVSTSERHGLAIMAFVLLLTMAICAAIVGGHRR